ncbi:MAG: HipA domain-containing protein [Fibrobacteres bacterium]|nr:HipA domain-containing protein [Fibrobacterota bacterium]
MNEETCKELFGTLKPPVLDLSLDRIQEYAAVSVLNRITVTGVQKKLSLNVQGKDRDSRLTWVGLWGNYILKPPADEYPQLPENEYTIMKLAVLAGIPTVPCGLIPLRSGELSFITKRIDRTPTGDKLCMEDFCQIAERLTEDKYRGSTEKVGKLILQYSEYPGIDLVDYFSRVVFNYIIGNSDMHLKNYSLIESSTGLRLAPAYDLVSTVLVLPEDREESALTINGKKAKLNRSDFDSLAKSLGLSEKQRDNVYSNYEECSDKFIISINDSPISADYKSRLIALIKQRITLIN